MITALAPAKINLSLVVGPMRPDGLHEVATIMQRLDLCDTISLEPADTLTVDGFADDTIVGRALASVAGAAGVEPRWRATIEKRIPVAAGLGGGSSDAATALVLANNLLDDPLPIRRLHELAAPLGADVAFFLEPGPQLATGTGSTLESLDLRLDYTVVLLLPDGETKPSTASVYARFDGEAGFEARRARLVEIARSGPAADLAALPPNDLASSHHAAELLALGALRADVSGAGPTVYGLFDDTRLAEHAAVVLGVSRAYLDGPSSVVRLMEMALTTNAGSLSGPGRYLKQHRYQLTLWTSAVEGLLVFVHVIPHLVMYILAVVAILFWVSAARRYKSAAARQLSWIFAASQSLAVLVLIVLFIAKAVAITLIAIIAIVALVVLFAERERA